MGANACAWDAKWCTKHRTSIPTVGMGSGGPGTIKNDPRIYVRLQKKINLNWEVRDSGPDTIKNKFPKSWAFVYPRGSEVPFGVSVTPSHPKDIRTGMKYEFSCFYNASKKNLFFNRFDLETIPRAIGGPYVQPRCLVSHHTPLVSCCNQLECVLWRSIGAVPKTLPATRHSFRSAFRIRHWQPVRYMGITHPV